MERMTLVIPFPFTRPPISWTLLLTFFVAGVVIFIIGLLTGMLILMGSMSVPNLLRSDREMVFY